MSGQNHDEPAGADGDVRSPRDGVDPEVLEFAQMLFQLARDGETERLAAYVDAGVSPDLTNERGDALLMLAAYNGHPAIVRDLLARGAEPDQANDRGQTPLAGAVFKGHTDVVRLLVEAGADPDAGTPSARAAADMFGRTEIVALFA